MPIKENQLIVIIGGTSFIGKHLIPKLAKKNKYRIRVVSRAVEKCKKEFRSLSDVEIAEGDLKKQKDFFRLLEPECKVINLLYDKHGNRNENLELMENLLKACSFIGIEQLLHVSSIDVVGRNADKVIVENSLCNPTSEYAITKLEIEKKLLSYNVNSLNVTIIRSAAIVGVGGENLVKLADDLLKGNRFINYLKSCIFSNRNMNLVCIGNVNAALEHLMSNAEKFRGNVFFISDDSNKANNYEYVEKLFIKVFKIKNGYLPRIKLPSFLLSLILRCARRDNINPNRIYSSKKIFDSGFHSPVELEDGLIEFAEWYFSNNKSKLDSYDC